MLHGPIVAPDFREPMYLKSLTLENVKCFGKSTLSFPHDEEGGYAGWNVLLGVNGTGKSTLLQAMALAMLGPISGGRLLQVPATWVRTGASFGQIEAELVHNPTIDSISTGQPRKSPYAVKLLVSGERPVSVQGLDMVQPQIAQVPSLAKSLNAGPYSGRHGWFSAGYGPFRRLSGGGGEENASILFGGGREARHLTLFRESAALTNCEKWLASLHNQSVDPSLAEGLRHSAQEHLNIARDVIDSLLPSGVKVSEVSSLGVIFRAPSGAQVAISQLSDGFRSFLALTIDLLRQILDAGMLDGWEPMGGGQPARIQVEGVVLIDEADTHLHPSWERDIGFRLCSVFPKIQFVVSAHSPFVAQAARPGGLFLVEAAEDGCVEVDVAAESVRGWRADQILLSPLFGLVSTRDPETEALLQAYDDLKSAGSLGNIASARLAELESQLKGRLTAPGDSLAERNRSSEMQAFIDARLAKWADKKA